MTWDQFVFIASLMVALAVVRVAWLARKPKERAFRCARCEKVADHNERTINAWRYQKVDFFCDECHAHWSAIRGRHPRPAASGCFAAFALVVAVPIALAAAAVALLART